jgi:hypothetical protein
MKIKGLMFVIGVLIITETLIFPDGGHLIIGHNVSEVK